MASFVDRVVGAARLDIRTYEEVERDTTATPQAMAVVVLVALASGIGAYTLGATGVFFTVVSQLVGWVVWAAIIWAIGTKMLPEAQTRSDVGELLRTIGFAASPGLLLVLRVIPLLGALLGLVVWIWQLVATVIAVRQALDYKSTGRAIVVCLIGWVAYVAIAMGFTMLFGFSSVALG